MDYWQAASAVIDDIPGWVWTACGIVWTAGVVVFLLLKRRRPITTLAWLIAFLSVPAVTVVAYFLFGPRRLDGQRQHRQAAKRAANREIETPGRDLSEDFAKACPARLALASVTRQSGEPSPWPCQAQAVDIYADGDTAYPALESAIAEARQSVHVEYYIYTPDEVGRRLRDLLSDKARSGVTVRVVVDAIGAHGCSEQFWSPLLQAGGEVRVFNPLRLLAPQPGKLNFRCHRKIVIVDGTIAFTGGINISDNNISDNGAEGKKRPAWRNTHIRLVGAPALDLQTIFLEDWLYSLPADAPKRALGDKIALPADIETWFPEHADSQGPWVQIVKSGPDEDTHDIHRLFFAAINQASQRLWITTPYFVPDEPMTVAIQTAAARGVDVQVIVPEKGDSRLVQAAALTHARDAAREGACFWLYQPVMNHSKVMIVDDDVVIVGTANLDNRSFRLNFEVVAAVYDQPFNARMSELFTLDRKQSIPLPIDAELSLLDRLMENTARLFSPLL